MTILSPSPIDGKPRISPPQFYCGFDGETDITWRGQKWAFRHHAPRGVKPECQDEYAAHVGTIRGTYGANRYHFPPAELLAYYPGYVGARYYHTGATHPLELSSGTVLEIRETAFEVESTPKTDTIDGRLVAIAWSQKMGVA